MRHTRFLVFALAIICLTFAMTAYAQSNESLRERIMAEVARRRTGAQPAEAQPVSRDLRSRVQPHPAEQPATSSEVSPAPAIESPGTVGTVARDHPSSPYTRSQPRTPPPSPAAAHDERYHRGDSSSRDWHTRRSGPPADRRYEDPRYEDRRYEDRRYEDPRYEDRRFDDRRLDDPRHAHSARHPPPGAAAIRGQPTPPQIDPSGCGAKEYINSLSNDDGVFVSLSMLLGDICKNDPQLCADTEQGRLDRQEVFNYLKQNFPYQTVSFEMSRGVDDWIDDNVDDDSESGDDYNNYHSGHRGGARGSGLPPARRTNTNNVDETERLKMVYINISELEADAVERRLLEAIEQHNRSHPNEPPFLPPTRQELSQQLDEKCIEDAFHAIFLRVGQDKRTMEQKKVLVREHLQQEVQKGIQNMVKALQDAAKKLEQETPKIQEKAMAHIDRYIEHFQTYPPALSQFTQKLLDALQDKNRELEEDHQEALHERRTQPSRGPYIRT